MRWAKVRHAGVRGTWTWDHIFFHDLLDDDGTLLGYVLEDARIGHGFTAQTNTAEGRAQFPTVATLDEAKAQLIHHFVLQRLEET